MSDGQRNGRSISGASRSIGSSTTSARALRRASSSRASTITASHSPAAEARCSGPLIADPKGLLDLPKGFRYQVFSREGDALATGDLVALFARDVAYDEPDNLTVGPHGFALACTDGEDDQWLVAITDDGNVYPFAFNRLNEEEFA